CPNEWKTTLTSTPRFAPQADATLSIAGFWTLSTQIVSFDAFAPACAAGVALAPSSASTAVTTTTSRMAERLPTFIDPPPPVRVPVGTRRPPMKQVQDP